MTHPAVNVQQTPKERLVGSVERITFHNEETGFCVCRAKVTGHRELITVIGNIVGIGEGEFIECQGTWINDKRFGLQFKAEQWQSMPPTSLEGIEKYLSSGMIKGIGPHFAKKLVKAFREAVFDVIEQTPQRLLELPGIGEKRKEAVLAAWNEQKSIRSIMLFLHSHGVGTARAVRIYKTYGEDSIHRIRENPYRLALDIHGIGFKTADALAAKLGIAKDAMIRAQAGVRHVLQNYCEQGHCAATPDLLITASTELLEIDTAIIQEALVKEIAEKNLINDVVEGESFIYTPSLYQAEVGAAKQLLRLKQCASTEQLPWGSIDLSKAIPWVEQISKLQLSVSQKAAVETVLQNKLAIITGGPGVGKTTVVNTILKILLAKKMRVALCAPTGRAAKRMSEATQFPAKTIHRLLEFLPHKRAFKYDQNNLLPVDYVIVDESSMIDIVLMHYLLKAIPLRAGLLFIGDVDQLPSVGSGAVLMDMIHAEVITVARLQEIFRQAAASHIVVNSHRINCGEMPLPNQENSDFYTIYCETPEEIFSKLMEVVTQRIPKRFHCNPAESIQVLTPMNRGGLGARALNEALQKALNPNTSGAASISRYGWTFAPGDKVIQNVNNYDKAVFNGDIGIIKQVDLEQTQVWVDFEGRAVAYDFSELDEMSLAYAVSIHKSQGSEYPFVVIPITMQHYMLLARNLLYTGVTRGKQFVVLIGQKKAIGMAIGKHKTTQRLTGLTQRLQQGRQKE